VASRRSAVINSKERKMKKELITLGALLAAVQGVACTGTTETEEPTTAAHPNSEPTTDQQPTADKKDQAPTDDVVAKPADTGVRPARLLGCW
jgi:hypothetical protein